MYRTGNVKIHYFNQKARYRSSKNLKSVFIIPNKSIKNSAIKTFMYCMNFYNIYGIFHLINYYLLSQ